VFGAAAATGEQVRHVRPLGYTDHEEARMPTEDDDHRPLDLHAAHALDAATLVSDRAFDAIAPKVLAGEGPTSQLQAALARGVPITTALKRVGDVARGRLAEVRHAINFNRDAGLIDSPLTAVRNPDACDPLHDLLLIQHENGDAFVRGIQAKYGTPAYVERVVRSGRYGTVLTSPEVMAGFGQRGACEGVMDRIDAGRVSSLPVEDAEMKAAAMRTLEGRARIQPGYSSNWETFWERSRVTAGAGLGAFMATGIVEMVQALLRGERLQMDRSLRRALKGGVRAMAISEIARAFMIWLERRWTTVIGWTERAVRTASEWATPAAAMASFVFDVAVSVWHLLTGKLNGAQFWRRLVAKFGGALAACLGTALGFFVGSFLGPVMAILLACVGGAVFALWGETWAAMFFDSLAATMWKPPGGTALSGT
jgi:hypothetical protein